MASLLVKSTIITMAYASVLDVRVQTDKAALTVGGLRDEAAPTMDNHLNITAAGRSACVSALSTGRTPIDQSVGGYGIYSTKNCASVDNVTCATKYEAKDRDSHRRAAGEDDQFSLVGEVHLCEWRPELDRCEAGKVVTICPEEEVVEVAAQGGTDLDVMCSVINRSRITLQLSAVYHQKGTFNGRPTYVLPRGTETTSVVSAPDMECRDWCAGNAAAWAQKCVWPQNTCSGCDECASFPMTGAPGAEGDRYPAEIKFESEAMTGPQGAWASVNLCGGQGCWTMSWGDHHRFYVVSDAATPPASGWTANGDGWTAKATGDLTLSAHTR